jgi:hypothetical protein
MTIKVEGKGNISAEIIADSINYMGDRITTYRLHYHRFIHSEFMTHRMFCLDGGSKLEFELPSDGRIYKMTIRDFVHKWYNGSSEHRTSRKIKWDLSKIDPDKEYKAKEISECLGMKTPSNIRNACRNGELKSLNGDNKTNNEDFIILGYDFIQWEKNRGKRKFSLRNKLMNMKIRQLDEKTGKIVTCKVKDCCFSGEKEVFKISTENYSVAGSKDHRILTVDGWKRIEDLVVGKDHIIVKKFGVVENDRVDQLRYNKINGRWKQTFLRDIRDKKVNDQNYMCYDCGTDLLKVPFDLHHVIPVYKDISKAFDYNNIVALCVHCHQNRHKTQDWQKGSYLYGTPELLLDKKSIGMKETFDLEMDSEYENFIADGIVVHNSKNASSSRAIPVKSMLEYIEKNPAIPIHWGKNQSGMQAESENDAKVKVGSNYVENVEAWHLAKNSAIKYAKMFADAGYHKQIVNRLTEPFQFMNVICTATDFDNFFYLRDHNDAQPEIQQLARCMKETLDGCMKEAREASTPEELRFGEWHTPFVDRDRVSGKLIYLVDGVEVDVEDAIKISASCSAQVSYRKSDTSIEKALNIYDRLVGMEPKHSSPFEHVATPFSENEYLIRKKAYNLLKKEGNIPDNQNQAMYCGNFKGWTQYRKLLPGENYIENKNYKY